jgi:hypothetical protein
MPYSIKKKGKGHKVCKKGSNKCFSKKPMSKGKAARQMKAIYANESLFHKIVNHALSESFDQQMNDMKAALNAPPESKDSGSALLDQGYYFEWWKDVQGNMSGTIYDKNDDVVTDEVIDEVTSSSSGNWDSAEVARAIGLHSLKRHITWITPIPIDLSAEEIEVIYNLISKQTDAFIDEFKFRRLKTAAAEARVPRGKLRMTIEEIETFYYEVLHLKRAPADLEVDTDPFENLNRKFGKIMSWVDNTNPKERVEVLWDLIFHNDGEKHMDITTLFKDYPMSH